MALTTKKSSEVRGCCEAIWRKTPCLPSPKLVSLTPPCPKVRQSSDNLSTNKTNPGNSIPCDLGCLGASSEILAFGDYPLEHRKVGAFYASTAAFQIAMEDRQTNCLQETWPNYRQFGVQNCTGRSSQRRQPELQIDKPPSHQDFPKTRSPTFPGRRAAGPVMFRPLLCLSTASVGNEMPPTLHFQGVT